MSNQDPSDQDLKRITLETDSVFQSSDYNEGSVAGLNETHQCHHLSVEEEEAELLEFHHNKNEEILVSSSNNLDSFVKLLELVSLDMALSIKEIENTEMQVTSLTEANEGLQQVLKVINDSHSARVDVSKNNKENIVAVTGDRASDENLLEVSRTHQGIFLLYI